MPAWESLTHLRPASRAASRASGDASTSLVVSLFRSSISILQAQSGRIESMTSVRLEKISKHFGQTVAVDDINLSIGAGELFFLLGPSGCGKSTLLRLIAGLLEPSGGRIFFNNDDVTNLPTQARNAVMCFQSYALWPHMSVRENIRFGLQVRHLSAAEQNQRVDEALALVQMKEYGHRKPNELSGGQQQRV